MKAIRPMYKVPSRYVLSGTILSSEAARIAIFEMERLQERKFLTLLVDGWEDIARRSLYGTVLTEVDHHPVVLGLTDLTGKRANAETIVGLCIEDLKAMFVDPSQVAALCTDNPSVMKKTRKDWEILFPWVIVSLFT